jgi:hypothetical protein
MSRSHLDHLVLIITLSLKDQVSSASVPALGVSLPRMWWATGGVLGLLPMHAAGHHRDATNGTRKHTVMDRVISSYTPTIAALRYARRPRQATSSNAQPALIVATTPGLKDQGRLDFVRAEAHSLALRFPGAISLIEPRPDADARRPASARRPDRIPRALQHRPACIRASPSASPATKVALPAPP